jgi:hypothetical protein
VVEGGDMMNATDQKVVIESYLNAYNKFDIDGMLDLVHPKVIFKNIAKGKVNATANGVDELRQMASTSSTLFSSRCQKITGLDTAGQTSTVRIEFEGVLASDLTNGMKAGETIKVKGRTKFQFRDGKIFRLTDYG